MKSAGCYRLFWASSGGYSAQGELRVHRDHALKGTFRRHAGRWADEAPANVLH